MSNRLQHQLLADMYEAGVRVGTVIHLGAATVDFESPSEPLASFIDDTCEERYVLKQFEPVWPGYTALIREFARDRKEEEEDDKRLAARGFRESVAHAFAVQCPKAFLVSIEYQMQSCHEANPKREGFGSWSAGWGYYGTVWLLVDDIVEAAVQGVSIAKAHIRAEWQKAIDEKRVQKVRRARR